MDRDLLYAIGASEIAWQRLAWQPDSMELTSAAGRDAVSVAQLSSQAPIVRCYQLKGLWTLVFRSEKDAAKRRSRWGCSSASESRQQHQGV